LLTGPDLVKVEPVFHTGTRSERFTTSDRRKQE